MSARPSRVAAVAAALTVATALSACSQSGGTAASMGDEKVSVDSVQSALRDIRKQEPTANFGGVDAAVFLVLGNDLANIAKKHGVFSSQARAKAAFTKVKNPSSAAIKTVQGSMNYSSVLENPKASLEFSTLLQKADVKLNPRYGTWEKGKGPVPTVQNWITTAEGTSAQPAG